MVLGVLLDSGSIGNGAGWSWTPETKLSLPPVATLPTPHGMRGVSPEYLASWAP